MVSAPVVMHQIHPYVVRLMLRVMLPRHVHRLPRHTGIMACGGSFESRLWRAVRWRDSQLGWSGWSATINSNRFASVTRQVCMPIVATSLSYAALCTAGIFHQPVFFTHQIGDSNVPACTAHLPKEDDPHNTWDRTCRTHKWALCSGGVDAGSIIDLLAFEMLIDSPRFPVQPCYTSCSRRTFPSGVEPLLESEQHTHHSI